MFFPMELNNWVINPQKDFNVVIIIRRMPSIALPRSMHPVFNKAQRAVETIQISEVSRWNQTDKRVINHERFRLRSQLSWYKFEAALFVMFHVLYNSISFTYSQLKMKEKPDPKDFHFAK